MQELKTIIAGSRSIVDYRQVVQAIAAAPFKVSRVVSGTARGVDQMGERWGQENNVPVDRFPAQWDVFGKSAGYRRNEVMAANAEALIAIWDGKSKGTAHMIEIARKQNLKVFIYTI